MARGDDEGGGSAIGIFEILILVVLAFLLFNFLFPSTSLFSTGTANGLIFLLYKLFIAVLPVVGVCILGYVTFKLWVHYAQQDFISGMDFVLLEIVPPRDVLRSPKAMELFITNALYHFSYKGGREEYWQGAVWFWFSLELVSLEGQVHFYIRTPSRVKSLIETQMYAQFPQAQVKVVQDYTLAVDAISPESAWNAWGCELSLAKDESWPIKTYVDFGLDKDPKEELKVDPISPIVEFFGSLQKGEQAWMQTVVTASKKTWKTPGSWFKTHDWVRHSRYVMEEWLAPYTRIQVGIDGGTAKEIRPPDAYKNALAAMNAKTGKIGFDTGIRVMYVAKKEAWNMNNRRNIRLIWRQYAKPDCNEFTRVNSTQGDAYNSGWLGLSQKQVMILADRMLHEYREREFFHPPLRHKIFDDHKLNPVTRWIMKQFFLPYRHAPVFVLNTEEIASIWHFPGQILRTPTLERIESKEGSPPTNLPT
jgi:hypothetical protein